MSTFEKNMKNLNFHDYSRTFSLKSTQYEWARKEMTKKSMICLMLKPSKKKFLLWPPSSSNLNPFDYTIWGILENKINATSHPSIDSLKTAIEEERNKMSEAFIFKACKSFRRCVDTIIEKNGDHIEWIYCFVSIFWFC